MSLTLPTSMLQLIGDRFLRLGVSYDNTKFFIDIPASRQNTNRNRFTYVLTNGIVNGSYNLSSLLGAVVLDVELITDVRGKLIFTTNPTGNKVEKSIIYIDFEEGASLSYLLAEPGDYLIQQSGFRIIIDGGSVEDASIADSSNPRDIFSANDSDTRFYIIQENDF